MLAILWRVRSNEAIRDLHVEDDTAFTDLTESYLDRLGSGFDHETVQTVADANRRFEEGPFDAVVSDHDLPDGTEIDLLEDVHESNL